MSSRVVIPSKFNGGKLVKKFQLRNKYLTVVNIFFLMFLLYNRNINLTSCRCQIHPTESGGHLTSKVDSFFFFLFKVSTFSQQSVMCIVQINKWRCHSIKVNYQKLFCQKKSFYQQCREKGEQKTTHYPYLSLSFIFLVSDKKILVFFLYFATF